MSARKERPVARAREAKAMNLNDEELIAMWVTLRNDPLAIDIEIAEAGDALHSRIPSLAQTRAKQAMLTNLRCCMRAPARRSDLPTLVPTYERVLPKKLAAAAVLLVAVASTFVTKEATKHKERIAQSSAFCVDLPPNAMPLAPPRDEQGTPIGETASNNKPGSERDAEFAYRQLKLVEPVTPSQVGAIAHTTLQRCRPRSRIWIKVLRAWRSLLRKLERPDLAMPVLSAIAETSLSGSREQVDAWLALGKLALKERDTLGAKLIFERVVEQGASQAPRSVSNALVELARLARDELEESTLAKLMAKLVKIRASDAQQIHVWGLMGEVALQQRRVRKAQAALSRAERVYKTALTRGGEHKVKHLVKAWLDLPLRALIEAHDATRGSRR